jgi:LacI family transcriptional regulator
MRDVAEHAGVSVTTVSHVINNTRPVSDALRQRVEAVMLDLGYQPNTLARSLRRGETHTIGVIVPDNSNPFFAEVARGIEDTSFDHGYSVILCNSDRDLHKERLYINVLIEKQVDGILFVAAGMSADNIQPLLDRALPLVVVDRQIPALAVDTVLAANQHGGWLATQHLLELGHHRIGCIVGPEDIASSVERVSGYHQALSAHNLPVDEQLVIRGDFRYESGYAAGGRLLSLDDPPTAIFACNDLMAVGAMTKALEIGLSVPGDLSVIGFDDIRPAVYANPPITTIKQPKYEMGVASTALLLSRMRDSNRTPQQQVLETSLVIRQSTAPRQGNTLR